MIKAVLDLAGLGWVRLAAIGLAITAAFAAGWIGGLRWEQVSSLQAELRLEKAAARTAAEVAARDAAQKDAAISAQLREIARLEAEKADAALAAATIARSARAAEERARSRQEQVNELSKQLSDARKARTCDCSLSSDERRSVQGIRVQRPPVPNTRPRGEQPQDTDPSVAGSSGRPVP